MLWHMSDCFLWQPNRLHTKRWRPRPINRFVAHGGQKSDWAWNWIQSHRSSWLWWLWRCRAEFLLPGSSWFKKYSCAPGWSVMDLTLGSLYDLFIIFIIPVCLLHSVTFCYCDCAWSGSDRICARWASIDCRSEAKSPSALNLCWGRRLCSELSITALNWEYWEHVNILRKCIWAILSHILTCFEAISDLISHQGLDPNDPRVLGCPGMSWVFVFCGLRSSKDWRFGDVLPESPETGHGWSLRWCQSASLMASWPMPQGLVHLGSLVVSQGVQTLCPTGWQHNVGANGEGCHWSCHCSAVTHWMIDAMCSFSGLGYAECDLGANWKRGVPCLNMLRFASACIRPKTSQHSQRMTVVTCSHHMSPCQMGFEKNPKFIVCDFSGKALTAASCDIRVLWELSAWGQSLRLVFQAMVNTWTYVDQ